MKKKKECTYSGFDYIVSRIYIWNHIILGIAHWRIVFLKSWPIGKVSNLPSTLSWIWNRINISEVARKSIGTRSWSNEPRCCVLPVTDSKTRCFYTVILRIKLFSISITMTTVSNFSMLFMRTRSEILIA